jgi:hypothetical protein
VARCSRFMALRISFVAKTKLNSEYFIIFWVRAEGVAATCGIDVAGLTNANPIVFTLIQRINYDSRIYNVTFGR